MYSATGKVCLGDEKSSAKDRIERSEFLFNGSFDAAARVPPHPQPLKPVQRGGRETLQGEQGGVLPTSSRGRAEEVQGILRILREININYKE